MESLIRRLFERIDTIESESEEAVKKELEEAIRIETRVAHRKKIVIMFTPAIFAFLFSLFYYVVFMGYVLEVGSIELLIRVLFSPIFLGGLLASGGVFLWRYLQGDFIVDKRRSSDSETEYKKRDIEELVERDNYKLVMLEDKIASLDSRINEQLSKDAAITDEQRQEFIDTIKNRLKSEASDDLLNDLVSPIPERFLQNAHF